MFPLHQIPIFIERKKHGNRYDIDPATKTEIRYKNRVLKKTQQQLMKSYKLPRQVIVTILKE